MYISNAYVICMCEWLWIMSQYKKVFKSLICKESNNEGELLFSHQTFHVKSKKANHHSHVLMSDNVSRKPRMLMTTRLYSKKHAQVD